MTSHTVLVLHKRFSDYETLGELFCRVERDTLVLTLWKRILPLIAKIIEAFSEIIGHSPEELIARVLENEAFARKFDRMFDAMEQYAPPYPKQTV
jgi:hypothetical protein